MPTFTCIQGGGDADAAGREQPRDRGSTIRDQAPARAGADAAPTRARRRRRAGFRRHWCHRGGRRGGRLQVCDRPAAPARGVNARASEWGRRGGGASRTVAVFDGRQDCWAVGHMCARIRGSRRACSIDLAGGFGPLRVELGVPRMGGAGFKSCSNVFAKASLRPFTRTC